MRIPGLPKSHLSYCTNIHPGESWAEVKAALQKHLPLVKRRTCPENDFGVGLRLSALAASELHGNKNELRDFKTWLGAQGLYVFTLNGFPYGTFHGEAIKEKVYLPDWRSEERVVYSKHLAEVLAVLLPEGESGSISTVPVGFKAHFQSAAAVEAARANLIDFVVFAYSLEQTRKVHIALALEPEPGCYLEDTRGTLDFFEQFIFNDASLALLATTSLPEHACNFDTVRRYLGVCVDTCHAAVMFEDPLSMARALRAAQITIPKVQLTAALKVKLQPTADLKTLRAFAEGNYLHQSCLQDSSGNKQFFLDLPETLEHLATSEAENRNDYQELRSHFHVPVFVEELDGLQTTQRELQQFVQMLKQENFSSHYEVETYTFDVLPKNLLKNDVDESIGRELAWMLEALT